MSPTSLPYILAPTSHRSSTRDNALILPSVVRNHFTITTWLLLGALVQIALSFLPIRKLYTLVPVLFILGLRLTDYALIHFNYKANPYMAGVIPGKVTAMFPTSAGASPDPKDEKICVVLLGARSNDLNGVFAPAFGKIGDYFKAMQKDLEANAATNGFLGATNWLGSDDRATASENLTLYYFRSRQDVHDFAHGQVHRAGWDFWNKLVKEGKGARFSLMHEIFEAPKGAWECVYLNYKPTGFASTRHPIRDESGALQWVSPLVAAKGKYKTSNGRQGIDDGTGNEKYGQEPY